MSISRVFLCDDDGAYRALVRAVLEAEDIAVVGESDDAKGCLRKVADSEPDLVLVDQNMPRMEGITAVPRIIEQVPEASVIVFSTAPAKDLEQRALASGAHAFLQKPRDIFTLPDCLRVLAA
jgi:DNA-binding NarL/FixJ family response regulator